MCKSAAFLKPASQLNPSAKEWRPPQLHHIHTLHHSPPPPPHAAAPMVAFDGHHPQMLLWHLPLSHQLLHFHLGYSHSACTGAAYHPPPPLPLPAPGHPYSPAPPPLFVAEKKVLEYRVERAEKPAEVASRPPPPPPPPPPPRLKWVPRKTEVDSRAAAAVSSPAAVFRRRTTVMVRNIPNQLRRDFLLEFFDGYCTAHSLTYDFVYLPMDFRSKDNLGYAFVNFTSGVDALKFKKILQNYKWGTVETSKGSYTSKKICAISWANIQGKERLVKRFEASVFDCDDPEFLPVLFDPPRGGSDDSSPVVVGRVGRELS